MRERVKRERCEEERMSGWSGREREGEEEGEMRRRENEEREREVDYETYLNIKIYIKKQ